MIPQTDPGLAGILVEEDIIKDMAVAEAF